MQNWLLDPTGGNPENNDLNLDIVPNFISFTPRKFPLITSAL